MKNYKRSYPLTFQQMQYSHFSTQLAFCLIMLFPSLSFAQWTSQTSNTTTDLYGIHFPDAINGWAVGHGGVILRTEDGGNIWYLQPADASVVLHDVQAFSDQVAIAVGVNGTILKTTNGGGVLPVELSYFYAEVNQKGNVLLSWQTANEQNNSTAVDRVKLVNYQLLSLDGVLLQQGSLAFSGKEPSEIALNNLNPGAYILQLIDEETTSTERIFIK